MLRPAPGGREPVGVDHLGVSHQAHHPLRDGCGGGTDGQPAPVGGEVGVAGRVRGAPVAVALLEFARLVEHRRTGSHGAHHGFEQGHVYLLALSAAPGSVAVPEGHHRRGAGRDPCDRISETHGGERRWSVGRAGDRGESAHGLREGAESRSVAVRARLAEPGHPHQHQPGIDLVEYLPTDSPAFEGAGTEVLDHDVCLGSQAFEHLGAVGVTQVQPDAPLVACDDPPPEAVAVLLRSVRAERVPPRGVLHLDHVSAVVAEDLGAQGTGQDGRQVQHPEPVQGTRPGGSLEVVLRGALRICVVFHVTGGLHRTLHRPVRRQVSVPQSGTLFQVWPVERAGVNAAIGVMERCSTTL